VAAKKGLRGVEKKAGRTEKQSSGREGEGIKLPRFEPLKIVLTTRVLALTRWMEMHNALSRPVNWREEERAFINDRKKTRIASIRERTRCGARKVNWG